MAGGLQTQTVYSFLTTEFMYHLLVTSAHAFSSIIMITSLPDILIKTKHWNQSTTDTPGPASILMYNNSASPISLIYNPNHNVTSPMDLSNNFPSLNNHGIPFLWTSLRNFCHPLGLTLSWSQSTQPTKQAIFISTYNTITSANLAYLFVLHVFFKHGVSFHVISNRGLEFVLDFFQSLDMSRSKNIDLVLFSFLILFSFQVIFHFFYFQNSGVKVRSDLSHCHISHI